MLIERFVWILYKGFHIYTIGEYTYPNMQNYPFLWTKVCPKSLIGSTYIYIYIYLVIGNEKKIVTGPMNKFNTHTRNLICFFDYISEKRPSQEF